MRMLHYHLMLLATLVTGVLAVLHPVTHLVTCHAPAIVTPPASLGRVLVTTVSAGKLGHEAGITHICVTLVRETLARSPTLVMSPSSEARTAGVGEEVTSLIGLLALVRVVITLVESVTNPGAGVCLITAGPASGSQMRGRG